jgi:hypothetical protein
VGGSRQQGKWTQARSSVGDEIGRAGRRAARSETSPFRCARVGHSQLLLASARYWFNRRVYAQGLHTPRGQAAYTDRSISGGTWEPLQLSLSSASDHSHADRNQDMASPRTGHRHRALLRRKRGICMTSPSRGFDRQALRSADTDHALAPLTQTWVLHGLPLRHLRWSVGGEGSDRSFAVSSRRDLMHESALSDQLSYVMCITGNSVPTYS